MLPGTLVLAAAVTACAGPPVPAEWTVQLVEDATLGGEPVTPETAFYYPSAVSFDAAGRLYVLDRGNHRVQVFDTELRYWRTLGGAGAGPGSLRSPEGMWVEPDGGVIVADTRNRRLQPFGPGGEPLDPIPLDFWPLQVVAAGDRLYVLRLPGASMVLGPDPRPLVQVLTPSGRPVDAHVGAVMADAGVIYMLQNLLRLAPAPGGGFAVADTHLASRIRLYSPAGRLRREIPVLYKAQAWAPLGRTPRLLNDASIQGVARTATDLAWDSGRRLYWVLAGYVDRAADGGWIVARELYRYDPAGSYRGSAVLPFRGTVVGIAPDGRLWVADLDGVLHRFHVRDPDMEDLAGRRPG